MNGENEPFLVDSYDEQYKGIMLDLDNNPAAINDMYELKELSKDLGKELKKKTISPEVRQKAQELLAKINQQLTGHVVKESMRCVKPFLMVLSGGIAGGAVGGALGIGGVLALSAAKIIELSHLAPTEVAPVVIAAAVVALVAIAIVGAVVAKQKSMKEVKNPSVIGSSVLGNEKRGLGSGNFKSFQ